MFGPGARSRPGTWRPAARTGTAVVVSAAALLLIPTVAAAVLGLEVRWPFSLLWRIHVIPFSVGAWGAPWEAIALPASAFQEHALASLVAGTAQLASGAAPTAGLALVLHAASGVLRQWRSLVIRHALGAGVRSLFRFAGGRLLILGALGCALGLTVARVLVAALWSTWPPGIAAPSWSATSGPVTATLLPVVGLLVAAVAAVLLHVLERRVRAPVHLHGTSVSIGGAVLRFHRVLAALQVAGLLVVVYGSLLVARRTEAFRPGGEARPRSVGVAPVRWSGPGTGSPAERAAAYARLIEALRRVDSSAVVTSRGAWLGLGKGLGVITYCRDCFVGMEFKGLNAASVRAVAVSAGALARLSATITSGRDFTGADTLGAPRVAVLSDVAAYQLFPGSSAIGKTIRTGLGPEAESTVVGVVRWRAPRGLGTPGGRLPVLFLPLSQQPPTIAEVSGHSVARVSRALASATARREGPAFVVQPPVSLGRLLDDFQAPLDWFAAIFMVMSVLTAGLALYSLSTLLVQLVSVRQREIATRRALGAPTRHLVAWIAREALSVAVAGTALGLPIAWQVGWVLRANGPSLERAFMVLGGLALATGAVSVVVSLAAARRATRVDPVVVWSRVDS